MLNESTGTHGMSDYLLEGTARANFGEDLLRARKSSSSSDADFANRELRISLNTYKKCIDPSGAPLRLRRSTLVAIIRACKLDPTRFGLEFPVSRQRPRDPGSYARNDLGFLEGSYIQVRRLPSVESAIAVSTLNFTWDDARSLLTFHESTHALDNGASEPRVYRGDVHLQQDRSVFGLLSVENGETRLSLVHTPDLQKPGRRTTAHAPGTFRLHGVQLAPGAPNGTLRPIVSAIYLEHVSSAHLDVATLQSGILSANHPAFGRLTSELHHIEEQFIPRALALK